MIQSGTRKRGNSDENIAVPSTSKLRRTEDKSEGELEEFRKTSTYPGGELKLTEHGIIFQLKLLMLCLWRAIQEEYKKFRLATELPAAVKSNDIVFQYQNDDSEKWKFLLIQVKHKEGSTESKKIKESDLLNTDDKDFSLNKYFHSYLRIIRSTVENSIYSVFSNSEIEDVILITNIDFEDKLKNQFTKENIHEDKLFKLDKNNEIVNVFKFNREHSKLVEKMKPIFIKTSDFHKLIEKITERINNKKTMLDMRIPIFEEYYYPLIREVFDIANNKFRADFINDINLSEEAKKLREQLENILDTEQIKFPKKKYEPDENPNILNVSKFVEQIQILLEKNRKNKVVEIDNKSVEKKEYETFKDNIQKLAVHVFIERFNVIRFSSFNNNKNIAR